MSGSKYVPARYAEFENGVRSQLQEISAYTFLKPKAQEALVRALAEQLWEDLNFTNARVAKTHLENKQSRRRPEPKQQPSAEMEGAGAGSGFTAHPLLKGDGMTTRIAAWAAESLDHVLEQVDVSNKDKKDLKTELTPAYELQLKNALKARNAPRPGGKGVDPELEQKLQARNHARTKPNPFSG